MELNNKKPGEEIFHKVYRLKNGTCLNSEGFPLTKSRWQAGFKI